MAKWSNPIQLPANSLPPHNTKARVDTPRVSIWASYVTSFFSYHIHKLVHATRPLARRCRHSAPSANQPGKWRAGKKYLTDFVFAFSTFFTHFPRISIKILIFCFVLNFKDNLSKYKMLFNWLRIYRSLCSAKAFSLFIWFIFNVLWCLPVAKQTGNNNHTYSAFL